MSLSWLKTYLASPKPRGKQKSRVGTNILARTGTPSQHSSTLLVYKRNETHQKTSRRLSTDLSQNSKKKVMATGRIFQRQKLKCVMKRHSSGTWQSYCRVLKYKVCTINQYRTLVTYVFRALQVRSYHQICFVFKIDTFCREGNAWSRRPCLISGLLLQKPWPSCGPFHSSITQERPLPHVC